MKSSSSANSTISSKRLRDLFLRQPEHDAVDEDVLAARDLGVKSGAELDQRGDPPADDELAGARLGDAGDQLEQRALARAVAANHAQRAAGRDLERSRHCTAVNDSSGFRSRTRLPESSALLSVANCRRLPNLR